MAVNAFIFPGQGSQSVGMGRDLALAFPAAREVFEEVDEVLRQKLSRLMFEGPAEELTLTENAQPALLAVSMAALRVLEREAGIALKDKAILAAGHSLGEYAALAAANAFSLADAARLLRRRGTAMQHAVPPGAGAMAALLGVELAVAQSLCEEAAPVPGENRREVCDIANDNGGGQVVISGDAAAVERAIELARGRGVKRAMKLPVSAPFHCALMAPAAEVMAEALTETPPRPPAVPVIANVTAAKVTEPAAIRDLLIQQVTKTVRWRESVQAMTEIGVDRFIELGAGRVLAGLVKRIAPDSQAVSCGTPAELETLIKSL